MWPASWGHVGTEQFPPQRPTRIQASGPVPNIPELDMSLSYLLIENAQGPLYLEKFPVFKVESQFLLPKAKHSPVPEENPMLPVIGKAFRYVAAPCPAPHTPDLHQWSSP